MVCIGSGPGPKNVLCERVSDGRRLVVPYAVWKHKLSQSYDMYTSAVHLPGTEEVRLDALLQLLDIKARNISGGRVVYDASFSDNTTKAIWEAGLAMEITKLKGQTFWVRYTHKPNVKNGKTYDNYSVETFAPPGEELPFDPNAEEAPVVNGETTAPSTPGAVNPGGGSSGGWDENTTARVTKLESVKHASGLVASLYQGAGPEAFEQALAHVEQAAKTFYKLARGHELGKPSAAPQAAAPAPAAEPVQETAKIEPTASTPQEVAAQVEGVQVGAPVATPTPEAEPAAAATSSVDWD